MFYGLRLHHLYVLSFALLIYLANTWASDEPANSNDTDASDVTIETEESDADTATEYVIGVYYAHKADYTERQLLRSGLAQPEVDDLINAVAQGFADCIVTSLQKANNYESEFAVELLADGTAIDDVSLYFKSLDVPDTEDPLAVFDAESDACLDSLDASYGLR